MNLARTLSLAALVLTAVSIAHADTITSTASGGLWADPGSWVGNSVPGADDDAIVVGPVQVSGIISCQSLTVETAGSVTAAAAPNPRTLRVYGPVINGGTIADNGNYWFDLELHGDIVHAGVWSTHRVTLMGSGDREISDTSATGFDSEFATGPGASGDITVTTPVSFEGILDFTGFRLILQPGSHLTLVAASLAGEVLAGGNEIRFESWSYLQNCTIDDPVIVGDARVASATFTTRVVVLDSMRNTTHTGGGAATVEGDLINHGVIENDDYSFWFRVSDDVENHGTIAVPTFELTGVGVTHHLTMGPDANLFSPVFLPEFQASTLIAETPVTFGGGLSLGIGTLILEPGANLHFLNHSGLGSGTVEANGNTITTEGDNCALSHLTVDSAVFGDYVQLLADVDLRGGATVLGTVTSYPWGEANVTVQGRLRNEGHIGDGAHPVRITVLNDLENLGVMDNLQVTVAGAVDQIVAAGPGIATQLFVIESGLDGAGHQWYRDGAMLPGETGPSLTFDAVGAADYGRYHCEADGQVSRDVFITEFLDPTDVPGLASAALEQNHPNPFNPATNIAFSLDRPGHVSLVVYDLAGREVDRLVGGERGAGRHVVTWQPRNLSSGIYVYRLQANGVDVARKCSLLK